MIYYGRTTHSITVIPCVSLGMLAIIAYSLRVLFLMEKRMAKREERTEKMADKIIERKKIKK